MTRTAELELLLSMTSPTSEAAPRRTERLLEADVDWPRFARAAISHRVAPLVARHLLRHRPANAPAEIVGAFAHYLARNDTANEELVQELEGLLRAFEGAGVDCIPFKGPLLGQLAFGGWRFRQAGDIDFLTSREQVKTIIDVLTTRGFRENTDIETGAPLSVSDFDFFLRHGCELAFFRATDGLCVEPHWAVVPATMSVDLDYEAIWARRTTVALDGKEVPALSPEDHFLFLCIHASKHAWNNLQLACDIAAFLSRVGDLDRDSVLERARASGCLRMVLVGLALAERLYEAKLQPRERRLIDGDRAVGLLTEDLEAILDRVDRPLPPVTAISSLRMRLRERIRDKARYACRTIFTPTLAHRRIVALPRALDGGYVLVKLVHDYAASPARRLARALLSRAAVTRASSPASPRRSLVIDWLPDPAEGAGMPRAHRLVCALAEAGQEVTVFPVDGYSGRPSASELELPPGVAIVRYGGIGDLEKLLERTQGRFANIFVCRPMNMAHAVEILRRRPELLGRSRLIYDTEAIFGLRDWSRKALAGEEGTEQERARYIATEAALAKAADAVLAVTPRERQILVEQGVENVHLVSYATPACPGASPFDSRGRILFVGRLTDDDSPNVEGLLWFRDEVWPRLAGELRAQSLAPHVDVVGKCTASALERGFEGYTIVGAVEDLAPWYDRARVFVAPIRFGAGIPLKVVDAAAHGVPVVTTGFVADQLGWADGEELLAAAVDDPGSFADKVMAAYTDRGVWQRLRDGALARVERDYSPRGFLESLSEVVEDVEPR